MKWYDMFGGRKFITAFYIVSISWIALMSKHLDGIQFGGIAIATIGLYAWGNRNDKQIENK